MAIWSPIVCALSALKKLSQTLLNDSYTKNLGMSITGGATGELVGWLGATEERRQLLPGWR